MKLSHFLLTIVIMLLSGLAAWELLRTITALLHHALEVLP